jgi:two-component system phosphate regulon sensor histidine kinase PhoR
MRSATLRWVMLSSSILIALILVAQLYWLKRVYTLEEQHFNVSVIKSIRSMLNDMDIAETQGLPMKKLIEVLDINTYLVQLDTVPPKDSLQNYLTNELEDFDVWADCNVAVYNHQKKRYDYEYYLPTAASHFTQPVNTPLPFYNKNYNYLLLQFPHRSKYIIHEMIFWIISAVFLLLLLIGLSMSLFFLYRQKFLNELQKDFVDNFTHEFKTPLAVMKIASEVIVQPGIISNPERLSKYGHLIKEQTEHLEHQVTRLLKDATGENKKLIIKKENCQLNELVMQAIDQIEPLITKKGATIKFIKDENEPVVPADAAHLKLVIINLIENAIKYSLMDPYVIIQLQDAEDGFYAIIVKDKGIGIEGKYIKQIFKKFFRVPTGNVHNVTGFGLGLNFVKKVITAHNGKIGINSVVGIGTEIKLLLPKK